MNLPNGIDWQKPVITEQYSYELLKENPINSKAYFQAPWATLIDCMMNLTPDFPKFRIANDFINSLKNDTPSFTICQTYRFEELISHFKRLKIDTVFTPHATKEKKVIDGVKILPFPLFNPLHNELNSNSSKDLLYSFCGMHRSDYVSSIRREIFNDNHPKNCEIIERQKWHFDSDVYGNQVGSLQKTQLDDLFSVINKHEYINLLNRSRFSLCPGGVGPSSIRFYESLKSGSIPILLSDTMLLPKIKDLDWSSCIIKIPESDYKDLRDIINNITPEKEKELRENCIKAYKQVSGKNFTKCVRDYYEQ